MPTTHLNDDEVREIRRALQAALDLLPIPGGPVHADCRHDDIKPGATSLCNRGGRRPTTTQDPDAVTCLSCRQSTAWDAWVWRRTEAA